tara:strand:+ start:248 stop:511 length:264 start_codon:yes stop_codon:yes gene_type:complete
MKLHRADSIKIKELAEKHGLTFEEVEAIVSAPYNFIREESKKIEFTDGLSREEFDSMKKNFNIPSIGKLYASHFMYDQIQKKKNKKS